MSEVLSPFADELGDQFDKIVRDVKSLLGRVEKDIETKPGQWKATAGFKLRAKDGHTVQLPLNNPASILLCFGMRLVELADNGGFDVNATIPKECMAWIEQHKKTPAPAMSEVTAQG